VRDEENGAHPGLKRPPLLSCDESVPGEDGPSLLLPVIAPGQSPINDLIYMARRRSSTSASTVVTRMWADAQRDGRPAWHPLRKFRNSIP